MFLEYYGLQEQPFGVSPDPRYLFMSPTHREALASLFYGVTAGRGFMTVVARPGMGKTTLLFQLLQRLESSARTVFLFQTQSSPRDFMRSLMADLGIQDDSGDLVRIHSQLNEALLRESHAGRQFIVIVDEAQNLDPSVLEVVRMLSNFETPSKKLMQIILAGQPQLAGKLASPELLQLRQRLSIVARLKPFSLAEANLYIDHRLRVAGHNLEMPLFTEAARAMIAKYSEGIPRNINNICFNALTLGCALKQRNVGPQIIREVVEDLNLNALDEGVPLASSEIDRASIDESPAVPQERKKSFLRNLLPKFALPGLLLLLVLMVAIENGGSHAVSAALAAVGTHSDALEIEKSTPSIQKTTERAEMPDRRAARGTGHHAAPDSLVDSLNGDSLNQREPGPRTAGSGARSSATEARP